MTDRLSDAAERLLRALDDPLFRDPPEWIGREEIAALCAAVDREDEEAEAWCRSLLTGPAAQWSERVRATPGTHTVGMVRQLLKRMPALVERRPADALQLTSLAVAIAEVLRPRDYWPDHVLLARGQALRDHAYVLSFLGRYADALGVAERAERTFAQVPGADLDGARLALVKASALRMQNRGEEAIALTREAARTLLDYGETRRYVQARIIEAAMLYDSGAVPQAMEVWSAARNEPGADEVCQLRITHNVAVCLCDLGRQSEAVASFEQCIAGFARLAMPTEQTRSRWYLGNALLGTGRKGEAIAVLRRAWSELEALQLPIDGALSALDLAEALVMNGQPGEVPAICRDVISRLTEAGLAMQAVPALTLLREAAALGSATRKLIRVTHAKVKRAGREEARVSAGRVIP